MILYRNFFWAKNSVEFGDDYKLRFSDFLQIILNYQLKTHEDFLSPFLKKFNKYDEDNDGMITYVNSFFDKN